MTESRILREVLLAVGSRPDARAFRNNVGVALHRDGSRVVYGLHPGSSDLIGWRSLLIRPEHVGGRLAQFLALEVKAPAGRLTVEQKRFLEAVASAGGLSAVVRSPDEARHALEGWV